MRDTTTQVSGLIWSVADLLRSDFKSSEYGRVILPFTVLRRLDCLITPTRQDVINSSEVFTGNEPSDQDIKFRHAPDFQIHNTSNISLADIVDSKQDSLHRLSDYVGGFSKTAIEVFKRFSFENTCRRLEATELLNLTISQFVSIDLGAALSSREMGLIFDDLVRRFTELANETSGEHSTPRDVTSLMAALVTETNLGLLTRPGTYKEIYDPACGTGGLLSQTAEHLAGANHEAHFSMYGQEINPESWAIATSRMLMTGRNADQIALGNVFQEDGFPGKKFDYILTNPPFGVEWKKVADIVRAEHEDLGHEGRFGAGLPRINDGSLLFLQHILSKMKPVSASGQGGSRVVVMFNGSPMHTGGAGSGESEIRRWIVENDWLEGIIALPEGINYNTGIRTYLWILSNNKSINCRGKAVLVKAQDHWQKMRRSVGSKRKYLGNDEVTKIVDLYDETLSSIPDQNLNDHVSLVETQSFLYRQIFVERPLRLRFELTQASLYRISTLRPIQRVKEPAALLSALRELVGTMWPTKSKAFSSLRRTAENAGQIWPRGAAFEKAVRNAIGVRHEEGELQRHKGSPEPDPELREIVSIPFQDDPEDYFKNEILPRIPGAWISHDRTRVGCEIRPSLFHITELDGPFEPLQKFVRLETESIELPHFKPDREESFALKHLTAPYLHGVDSALELPDAPLDGSVVTPCSSGDLVGRFGNWRLLPRSFGEAVTTMFVLHPHRGNGRALCEWLNSRKENASSLQARDLLDIPVPVDLVTDPEIDDLLEEVQEGRLTLQTVSTSTLPNIFSGSERLSEEIRKSARFSVREARLVDQLIRPFDDPVWRAESSYPFHLASLARRYRVSTHPAERKDGLLKLAEGTARTLGILALSELIALQGFSGTLRKQFRNGATFGTWTNLIKRFLEEVDNPRIQEMLALREDDTTQNILEDIKGFRNHSHHSHGVRISHELDEDVEKLEPRVLSLISSVNWLSGLHWDWVERCEYLDDSSFRTVGLRLRGSHPSWEPFERSTTYPLRPDRIYVASMPSGQPIDLRPLAMASLCSDCRTRELFLLDQVRDGQATLRSLEEHPLEISYATSGEA